MCEYWTADDEKALLELQQRRDTVMTKRRNVLEAVVGKFALDLKSYEYDSDLRTDVTDELIKHADAINDALKPFTRKEGIRAKTIDVPIAIPVSDLEGLSL